MKDLQRAYASACEFAPHCDPWAFILHASASTHTQAKSRVVTAKIRDLLHLKNLRPSPADNTYTSKITGRIMGLLPVSLSI